jgi:hypothetical protein
MDISDVISTRRDENRKYLFTQLTHDAPITHIPSSHTPQNHLIRPSLTTYLSYFPSSANYLPLLTLAPLKNSYSHTATLALNSLDQIGLCISWRANRLAYPNQQHTLRHDTIRVVEMQHAQSGLQAVEAETRPCCEVIGEALVVHYFEPGWERELVLEREVMGGLRNVVSEMRRAMRLSSKGMT